VLPHAVAVLDGASEREKPYGRDGGWYPRTLTEALTPALAFEADVSAVEEAIAEVSSAHSLPSPWSEGSGIADCGRPVERTASGCVEQTVVLSLGGACQG
jgi:hypothetical protein